jgi:5-oxoprolinase (ATP-hydrolysing) subunit C
VQVPGNGVPIVLLADAGTVGGYPKIATVVSVDLPRLATASVGAPLRFVAVTVAQAEALARASEAELQRCIASIASMPCVAGIDLDALYASNLVGGMIDARDPRD